MPRAKPRFCATFRRSRRVMGESWARRRAGDGARNERMLAARNGRFVHGGLFTDLSVLLRQCRGRVAQRHASYRRLRNGPRDGTLKLESVGLHPGAAFSVRICRGECSGASVSPARQYDGPSAARCLTARPGSHPISPSITARLIHLLNDALEDPEVTHDIADLSASWIMSICCERRFPADPARDGRRRRVADKRGSCPRRNRPRRRFIARCRWREDLRE